MSKNQYNAPAIEVVEFGKEDAVCTASGPISWVVIDPETGETTDRGDIGTGVGSPEDW